MYRRAQRRWEQVALLMIDLDRFKKINDEYGHPAGDVVLSDVPAGRYSLVALPLRLTDADSAPLRAVLLELEQS